MYHVKNNTENTIHVGIYSFEPGLTKKEYIPEKILTALLKNAGISIISDFVYQEPKLIMFDLTVNPETFLDRESLQVGSEHAQSEFERINEIKSVMKIYSEIANCNDRVVLKLLSEGANFPTVRERADLRLKKLQEEATGVNKDAAEKQNGSIKTEGELPDQSKLLGGDTGSLGRNLEKQ